MVDQNGGNFERFQKLQKKIAFYPNRKSFSDKEIEILTLQALKGNKMKGAKNPRLQQHAATRPTNSNNKTNNIGKKSKAKTVFFLRRVRNCVLRWFHSQCRVYQYSLFATQLFVEELAYSTGILRIPKNRERLLSWKKKNKLPCVMPLSCVELSFSRNQR